MPWCPKSTFRAALKAACRVMIWILRQLINSAESCSCWAVRSLNACYTRVQAEAISDVIDYVIGMNATIGDKAASAFAASFYRAIGFGRSVKDSFDQGCS